MGVDDEVGASFVVEVGVGVWVRNSVGAWVMVGAGGWRFVLGLGRRAAGRGGGGEKGKVR